MIEQYPHAGKVLRENDETLLLEGQDKTTATLFAKSMLDDLKYHDDGTATFVASTYSIIRVVAVV